MTSDRQQRANQANAKASKGPKTKGGRARSARNALRHGLSIPVRKEPSLSIQAEEIALKLAGPDPDEALLDRARAIGEAQVDLNRVRARRNALVSQLLADPEYQPLSAYKIQARRVRSVERVCQILRRFPNFRDIKPQIGLKPLKDEENFATIVEDRIRELV